MYIRPIVYNTELGITVAYALKKSISQSLMVMSHYFLSTSSCTVTVESIHDQDINIIGDCVLLRLISIFHHYLTQFLFLIQWHGSFYVVIELWSSIALVTLWPVCLCDIDIVQLIACILICPLRFILGILNQSKTGKSAVTLYRAKKRTILVSVLSS